MAVLIKWSPFLRRFEDVKFFGNFKEERTKVSHKTGGTMDCVIDIIGESIDTAGVHTYLVKTRTETLQPCKDTETGSLKVVREAE